MHVENGLIHIYVRHGAIQAEHISANRVLEEHIDAIWTHNNFRFDFGPAAGKISRRRAV